MIRNDDIIIINSLSKRRDMSAITITFGDQAVTHEGMQQIGKMSEQGFSIEQMQNAKLKFENKGYKCDMINLNAYLPEDVKAQQTCILVVKKGIECLVQQYENTAKQLFQEMLKQKWDSKVLMYGKVVNKHARHLLSFYEEPQEPDYEKGKGRIVGWKDVPILDKCREQLGYYFKGGEELAAEGNYYFDSSKCGVGFHGDAERKKVIALRMCEGKCFPLHYQWFLKGHAIGSRAIVELNDGDLYVMSEKAVGTDWRKKNSVTIRHATGADKFVNI